MVVCIGMHRRKAPPGIQFYEEEPERTAPFMSSRLTSHIRALSFGLIKTDRQASAAVVLIILAATAATYIFIQDQESVEPTVYYELLPQESVGSAQGLPPQTVYEE
jgi:hypothetical protein